MPALFLTIIVLVVGTLIAKCRESKPYEGRDLELPAKEYHAAVSRLLSPFSSTEFAKALIKNAYDSIKGDYDAYRRGEKSDYLETLFGSEYASSPRDVCYAICFILECIRFPSGFEERQAVADFYERLENRIAGIYDHCVETKTLFPHGIVDCSAKALRAISERSKYKLSQSIQNIKKPG